MAGSQNIPRHFFKFIPPGCRFNLSIPKSFLEFLNKGPKHENALLQRGSQKWAVKIENDGVLGEGWSKFATDNGVEEFDFVVFKHEGNMVFETMVFDPTTCEREYPDFIDEIELVEKEKENAQAKSPKEHTEIHGHKGSMKRERNIESQSEQPLASSEVGDHPYFIDKLTPYNLKRSKLPIPMKFAQSNGLITNRKCTEIILKDEKERSWPAAFRLEDTHFFLTCRQDFKIANGLKAGDAYKLELTEQGEVPVMQFHCIRKPEHKEVRSGNNSGLQKPAKEKRKNDVPQRRQNLESSLVVDHPSFNSNITPYGIKKSVLSIPLEFARSNRLISDRRLKPVILRDEKDRSWAAVLRKKQTQKQTQILLTAWHKFRIANGLKTGDAYMLKLVENGEMPVMKFYYLGNKTMKTRVNAMEATDSAPDDHRFFISTLKPCSFNRSVLYVPIGFAISNGLKSGEMIIRDEKLRNWKVELKDIGKQSLYIGRGFGAFRDANGLKEGDPFKIELIENEQNKPPVVNFTLLGNKLIEYHKIAKVGCPIPKSKVAKSHAAAGNGESSVRINSTRTHIKAEKDTKTIPDNPQPYFIGTLKSYSMKSKALLYLPTQFARSNGLISNKEMIIKSGQNERSWTVDFRNCKDNYFYIGRGWSDFRDANGLQEGDRFKFELVENGETAVVKFSMQVMVKKIKANSFYIASGFRDFLIANGLKQGDVFKFELIDNGPMYLPRQFSRSNGLKSRKRKIQL